MLGLDASGALEQLKGFSADSEEAMNKFTERAKAMLPPSTFDAIAKSAKVTFAEAAKDAAAMGYAAKKAFDDTATAAAKAADQAHRLKEASSSLRGIMGIGLGAGVLATHSLIAQGNSTSGLGAVVGWQQERLAREVAGLFAPITAENTGRVAELTGWFRQLTGAQQESIRMMSMFTTTTTGLLYVLPKASSALATMFGASTGVAKAFGVAGVAASIGIGVMSSTREGREGLTDIAKALEPASESLLKAVQQMTPAVNSFARAISTVANNRGVQTAVAGGATILGDAPGTAAGAAIGARFGFLGAGVGAAIGSLGDALTHGNAGANVVNHAVAWLRQRLHGETPEQAEAGVARRLRTDFGFLPSGVRTFFFGRAAGDETASAPPGRSQWAPRANGIEGITDIWDRLNSAAQINELQRQTAENTGNMAAGIANLVTAANQILVNLGGAPAQPGAAGGPAVVN
ncbi:MAG TPA: hypothetical protein VHR72_01760 [Gemmataceae bacterium]|jgi:hypothetical protein|nr:hypothetical protein [Gemmataceae bacterium]